MDNKVSSVTQFSAGQSKEPEESGKRGNVGHAVQLPLAENAGVWNKKRYKKNADAQFRSHKSYPPVGRRVPFFLAAAVEITDASVAIFSIKDLHFY